MLHDTGTFPHKYTGTCPQIVRTMSRMPDLSALDNIGDIIMLAPNVLEFVFQRTIIFRDQCIAATQLAMIYRIANYLIVKIEHNGRLEDKIKNTIINYHLNCVNIARTCLVGRLLLAGEHNIPGRQHFNRSSCQLSPSFSEKPGS